MALIKCTECGREVSDKALTCPACGNPIAQAASAAAQASSPPQVAQPAGTDRKSQVWNWVGTIAALALAFVLNPTASSHRAKLRTAIEDRHPIAGLFGVAQLAALDVRYTSLGIASYT
jgi:uncharacterized membrane protein YvbJ